TWCVAKPSTSDIALKDNIEYACSQVDCSVIERGEPCFYPDTLVSHASVAMNLYYQSRGRNYWNCYFNNSAVTTVTDPSQYELQLSCFYLVLFFLKEIILFDCRLWTLQVCLAEETSPT
ncbi:hypothetical protein B296_00037851, partial [Ensete ventricosum]